MNRSDPGLQRVLDRFGVAPAALIGHGGEAGVYDLGDDRVLRVLHAQGTVAALDGPLRLLDEFDRTAFPFSLPEVLDVGTVAGRAYAIERRLPGRSVLAELPRLDARSRRGLIEAHLDASAGIGDLALDSRPWWGDLVAPKPVRAESWRSYLEAKAADSLDRAPGFDRVDPAALAAALPDTDSPAFVHLDAFAGNMLAVGTTVTAIIDVGQTSVWGDRRLDPLSAAVYFCSPSITPVVRESDHAVVRGWLGNAGLADWYEPARRWLAAYWAWAREDRRLHAWCRSVLVTDD